MILTLNNMYSDFGVVDHHLFLAMLLQIRRAADKNSGSCVSHDEMTLQTLQLCNCAIVWSSPHRPQHKCWPEFNYDSSKYSYSQLPGFPLGVIMIVY